MAGDHKRTCAEGRSLGAVMARIADAESVLLAAQDEPDERCVSCAFRAGTVPNGCLQTQLDVYKAISEKVPFLCHAKLGSDGKPHAVCHGWFAVMQRVKKIEAVTGIALPPVPWEFSPPDEESEAPTHDH